MCCPCGGCRINFSFNQRMGFLGKHKQRRSDFVGWDCVCVAPRVYAGSEPGRSAIVRTLTGCGNRQMPANSDNLHIFNACTKVHYKDDQSLTLHHIPIRNHHACSLARIIAFTREAVEILTRDSAASILVHCKAGRGRTGMLICCLLLQLGICQTPADAVYFYTLKRMQHGSRESAPQRQSQLRYIEYYYRWMHCAKEEASAASMGFSLIGNARLAAVESVSADDLCIWARLPDGRLAWAWVNTRHCDAGPIPLELQSNQLPREMIGSILVHKGHWSKDAAV